MASSGELEQTLSADGNSTAVQVQGRARLSLTGGFGGGTAKLQAETPSGSWVDIASASFTAVTDTLFDFPPRSETNLRVNLNGATAPSLLIWIQAAAPYR